MKEYLAQNLIEYGLILGAIIGGVAAMKTSKEKLINRILSFFVGVPVAVLVSPLLCNLLSVTAENARTGVAVIAGYGGISALDRLLNITYKKLEKDGDV